MVYRGSRVFDNQAAEKFIVLAEMKNLVRFKPTQLLCFFVRPETRDNFLAIPAHIDLDR